MALAILDGNQSATTLSTILTSGQHIPAHTVVSLGTQAITDMRSAVSGSVVSISNFPATQPVSIASVTVGNSVTIGSLPAISGTVTAMAGTNFANEIYNGIFNFSENAQIGVYVTDPLPTGSNNIGRVTIGAGTVTIGAGTAQIGSVTASISGTVPVSISSVTVGNSVTIASLPAVTVGELPLWSTYDSGNDSLKVSINEVGGSIIDGSSVPISGTVTVGNSVTIGSLPLIAGTVTANVFGKDANSPATAQIPVISYDEGIVGAGSSYVVPVQVTNLGGQISEANPLPISGTVTAVNHQGTAVTTSNFTSTTASTVLAGYNATREVLTIFNEGAGNLHICAGATCTTIAYQVRLSAGDYYEVPNHQTTITHSAVFATAGTARVTQVS